MLDATWCYVWCYKVSPIWVHVRQELQPWSTSLCRLSSHSMLLLQQTESYMWLRCSHTRTLYSHVSYGSACTDSYQESYSVNGDTCLVFSVFQGSPASRTFIAMIAYHYNALGEAHFVVALERVWSWTAEKVVAVSIGDQINAIS